MALCLYFGLTSQNIKVGMALLLCWLLCFIYFVIIIYSADSDFLYHIFLFCRTTAINRRGKRYRQYVERHTARHRAWKYEKAAFRFGKPQERIRDWNSARANKKTCTHERTDTLRLDEIQKVRFVHVERKANFNRRLCERNLSFRRLCAYHLQLQGRRRKDYFWRYRELRTRRIYRTAKK